MPKISNEDLSQKIAGVETRLQSRIREQNKSLRNEIAQVGKIAMDTQSAMNGLVNWQTRVLAVEEDRKLREAVSKNPNMKIILELLKLLGWALLIIAAVLKVDL